MGKGGVAVIRISGNNALKAVNEMTRIKPKPEPRLASLTTFHHSKTKKPIDTGLLLYFPSPNSFTGEDVIEFHTHSSLSVIRQCLDSLGEIEGYVMAEAGEFTRRAFERGKLDLTQAEGILDLIDAETDAQHEQALSQMKGDLFKMYERWSNELTRYLSRMEAIIDFGDDEHLDADIMVPVFSQAEKLVSEIRAHLNDGRRG